MATEPLLEELWKHKSALETEEKTENTAVGLYFDMRENAEKYPILAAPTKELEKWISEYTDGIMRRMHDRKSGESLDTVQSSDENQKRIHDALIATINQLARMYGKLGLYNGWRQKIIGLDRDDAAAWALDVARAVLGKNIPS